MGGGLMQLVAYGAQDVYLTGNPQITFFKVVYRRHTNFAVEPIQQTWNGAPDFGRTVTCNINRNGDLITNMYLAVTLNTITPDANSANFAWGYVKRLGHALVEDVKIEIGGSKIDEQYGEWLNIWYELTHKTGQERGYAKMIGDIPMLTDIVVGQKQAYQLYVPLQFWFNRNNGLALPLIALQYHDVRITLIYKKAIDCMNWVGSSGQIPPTSCVPSMQDSYLLIDYVYLDSEERKRFAQASHEYLIEQLQFTGSESLNSTGPKIRLNFNHPCKYLVWVPRLDKYFNRSDWLAYADDANDWDGAKDRFAKLLYLATRANLSPNANNTGSFNLTTQQIWIDKGSGGTKAVAAGDLFNPAQASGLSSVVLKLLGHFDAKCVCQNDIAGSATTLALIADLSTVSGVDSVTNTNNLLLQQLLNNVIITRNDLTMQDISNAISDLGLPSTNNTSLPSGVSSNFIAYVGTVSIVNYTNYGNFIDGSDNPVYSGKLQLNGHDRFQARDGNYFNYVQPYQHFSNTPADGINVYSFALKAEDHQPTGTCNFSRIDNATLQINVGLYNQDYSTYQKEYIGVNSLLNIYTVNYNVLRVMSGMAGTAYSN
uniref:Major capsid protein N-terminal domain-containing protein n=1 Tax=viral metagenome TaxID=1070528 RepID=A0A6C0EEC9_9ZZZZ